jgi:biopolymer transport protein ExbB
MHRNEVFRWLSFCATVLLLLGMSLSLSAQEPAAADGAAQEAGIVDSEQLKELTSADAKNGSKELSTTQSLMQSGINFFNLLILGGWMMIPIGLMSILVVTISLERFFALRRRRIIPPKLVRGLQELSKLDDSIDPVAAYKLCQRYPSAAATVTRTMLLKVGRPMAEMEHAVAEASQREADRMYSNVRWLNMATAVTPLMGLLGTVWGMIEAFHATTQLLPGQDRAEQLAEGIYIALVTTLAGLIVAIPSAISAHYFEGKITSLFRRMDELLFHLMAQVERYEGKARFDGTTTRPLRKPVENAKPASSSTSSSATASPPRTIPVSPATGTDRAKGKA